MKISKVVKMFRLPFALAGAARFGLANDGIKIHCLTTWLYPYNVQHTLNALSTHSVCWTFDPCDRIVRWHFSASSRYSAKLSSAFATAPTCLKAPSIDAHCLVAVAVPIRGLLIGCYRFRLYRLSSELICLPLCPRL